MSNGREVHRAAKVVVIIGSLQGCSLPFRSSSSELDGRSILNHLEADTSGSVRNPSDEDSMQSGNQHFTF